MIPAGDKAAAKGLDGSAGGLGVQIMRICEMTHGNFLKYSILLFMLCCFSGCGTILTNNQDFQIEYQESGCTGGYPDWLPRMYSGVAFDLWAVKEEIPRGGQIGAMLFWDIPFSLVTDTLFLPLTSYLQVRYGNLTCNSAVPEAGQPRNRIRIIPPDTANP